MRTNFLLILFSLFLVSCNISKKKSVCIIGGVNRPTAIYVRNDSNFLVRKSLDMIQHLCVLAKDSVYIQYHTYNAEIIKFIEHLSSCNPKSNYTAFKIKNLHPFSNTLFGNDVNNNNLTERAYQSIPLRINSYSGSVKLAATSLLACEDIFHYDKLNEACMFIYSFDKFCCMVLFIPRKEYIVQSYANFMIHPMLINLHTEEQMKDFFYNVMGVHGLNIEIIK